MSIYNVNIINIFLEVDMEQRKEIKITKKSAKKGDDGYKIVSVRMKDETIEQLDILSGKTNRSRNEIINILLESALNIVTVDENDK